MPPRPRHIDPQLAFEALAVEGSLIAPAWLARIALLQAEGQADTDYRIQKGLNLRDEIGRYWRIAQGLWSDFAEARSAGADPQAAARRFVPALLREAFGFTSLGPASPVFIGDRSFPIGHQALGGSVPLVVAPAGLGLDKAIADLGDGGRRRSAFGLLQEYLNATETTLWGVACDGATLRIARDNGSLTRPAWIEADLERIFTEERYADFTALWLLGHESRFGHAERPPASCLLEVWRTAGREEGTRARDHLRDGVEEALRILGQGFLAQPDNQPLRAALQAGELTRQAYFQQLLRLVYRLIFLLTAEERELLHPSGTPEAARALYAGGYSARRLRDAAVKRSAHDRYGDRWEALKITWRGLADGEPVLALPALGGLFADDQCPALDAAKIENRVLLAAMFRLAWLREPTGLSRVNWRDMGPEELGSVYESLLELEPQVTQGARRFDFATGAEARGNARKLTGSYYTPDALVQMLLDSALEPVIEATVAAHPGQAAEALLALSVIDPACGSGHFLLAAARRLAAHVARHSVDGTPSAADYRRALRQVVGRCIFGVDRNPMALELARTALWLEAMTPDAPLTFVDHHLVCGDALLGLMDLNAPAAGVPPAAFKELAGDDAAVAKRLAETNRDGLKALRGQGGQLLITTYDPYLAEKRRRLDAMPDGSLEAIAAKREAQRELAAASADTATFPAARAADYYLAAFLAPKRPDHEARVPTTTDVRLGALAGLSNRPGVEKLVREIVAEAQVLHWPITFAQVFARGGFDVVLGNPPWERIKLSEQEFFASRDPAIAGARTQAERGKLIAVLASAPADTPEHRLYSAFQEAKRTTEAAAAFAHAGRRYPLTGSGDLNTYALFAETTLQLLSPRGRAGIIVPSGVATDNTTKDFFAHISDGRLVQLLDFENREGIFPGVHKSTKFCLLTLGRSPEASLAFYLSRVEEAQDPRRRFSLAPADYEAVNPNTRNCPTFRSQMDAELAKKIHRQVPVLWNESRPDGNPWGLQVATRFFHMAEDSSHFRTADQLLGAGAQPAGLDWITPDAARYVRLFEGKMIHQFDHRFATFDGPGEDGTRDVTSHEKADPMFAVRPRYWVTLAEAESRFTERAWDRPWALGYRSTTNATNERTVIASLLPRGANGHKITLQFPSKGVPPSQILALLANLNCLVLDFAARFKVGGADLSSFLMKQLPVLPPTWYSATDLAFIAERAAELIFTGNDLADAANWFGYPLVQPSPERRAQLRAELDAYFAALYGLSRDNLRYILDPADVMGAGYPSETFRRLREKETGLYGEYRTRRMVLEAWDHLAQDGTLPAIAPTAATP